MSSIAGTFDIRGKRVAHHFGTVEWVVVVVGAKVATRTVHLRLADCVLVRRVASGWRDQRSE